VTIFKRRSVTRLVCFLSYFSLKCIYFYMNTHIKHIYRLKLIFRKRGAVATEILELAVANDELASNLTTSVHPTAEYGWAVYTIRRPAFCIWTGGKTENTIKLKIRSYFCIRTGPKTGLQAYIYQNFFSSGRRNHIIQMYLESM